MKRFISFVCVIALMLSLGNVALAADTTATLLRLESTEGTVTITNAAGRTLTATSDMRLMNGYTITTGAASYAYISLDSTKVVKLDGLSSCTIRQQGNKLELLLGSGNLFFNVTEPLEANASLTIRTSTMATGVRGTSGLVWCDGVKESGTRLYTGAVTVTTYGGTDDLSALEVLQTAVITAGQEALSTHDADTGETSLEILGMGLDDYSGFELDAIANENGLLDEILENGDTSITQELVDTAQEKVEEEQASQQETQDHADTAQSSQTTSDDTAQSDTVTATSSSSGSSSSSSSSGDTTTADITVETYTDLVSALAETGAVVTLSGDITATEDITVSSDGDLTVASGATLDMGDNALIVEGDLTVEGTVTGTGTVVQANGDGYVDLSGGIIESSDSSDYSGAVTNAMDTTGYTANSFMLSNVSYADAETPTILLNGGMCIIFSGTIDSSVGSGVSITNDGYLGVTGGSIETSGTAVSVTDGSVYVTGGTVTGDAMALHMAGGFASVTGGTVTSGSTTDAAVYMDAGGLTMIGGTITSSVIAIEAEGAATVSIQGGLVESTGSSHAIVCGASTSFSMKTLDSDSTTTTPTIRSAGNTGVCTLPTTLEDYCDVEEVGDYYYLTYEDGSTTAVTITPDDWSDVTTAVTTYDSVTISGNVIAATSSLILSSGKTLIISDNCALTMDAGVFIQVESDASLTVNETGSITGSTSANTSPITVAGGDVTVLGRVNGTNAVPTITVTAGVLDVGSTDSTLASISNTAGEAINNTGGTVTIYGGTVSSDSTEYYAICDTSSAGLTIAGTLTTDGTDGTFIRSKSSNVVYSGGEAYVGEAFTVADQTYYYLTSYISGATSSSTTVNPGAWGSVTDLFDETNTNHYDSVTISGNVIMTDNYTIPEGKTLIVAAGVTLDLDKYTLTIDGTVEVYGTISSEIGTGTISMTGSTANLALYSTGAISTVDTAVTVTAGRMSVTEGTVSSEADTAIYVGATGTLDVYEITNCTIKSKSAAVVDFAVDGNTIDTQYNEDEYYYLTSYTATT